MFVWCALCCIRRHRPDWANRTERINCVTPIIKPLKRRRKKAIKSNMRCLAVAVSSFGCSTNFYAMRETIDQSASTSALVRVREEFRLLILENHRIEWHTFRKFEGIAPHLDSSPCPNGMFENRNWQKVTVNELDTFFSRNWNVVRLLWGHSCNVCVRWNTFLYEPHISSTPSQNNL